MYQNFKKGELLFYHKRYKETGREEYLNIILERFEPLLKKQARKYTNDSFEQEDLIQEGRVAIWLSLIKKDYEEESHLVRKVVFDLKNIFLKAYKKSHIGEAIPVDSFYEKDYSFDIEEKLLIEDFFNRLVRRLTTKQRAVFELIREGYSLSDIAKQWGVTIVNISQMWQQIKLKAKQVQRGFNYTF